jgi:hypothetical protein
MRSMQGLASTSGTLTQVGCVQPPYHATKGGCQPQGAKRPAAAPGREVVGCEGLGVGYHKGLRMGMTRAWAGSAELACVVAFNSMTNHGHFRECCWHGSVSRPLAMRCRGWARQGAAAAQLTRPTPLTAHIAAPTCKEVQKEKREVVVAQSRQPAPKILPRWK